MYSTCLFCHAALGVNDAIEHFPVGRRLAFDAAKGRLWAVCRACERWNLTPIDERWEAIEECERSFRETRLRVSTDNVGLAKLREGTTLIRIGAPQRPELAAWRYGDQFGRRRRRTFAATGALAVGMGGLAIAGPLMGIFTMSGLLGIYNITSLWSEFRYVDIAARGKHHRVWQWMLQSTQLRQHELFGYEIHIPHRPPWWHERGWTSPLTFRDDEALRVARTLLPRVNAEGGDAQSVRDAVDLLEATPCASDMFRHVASGHYRPMTKVWSGKKTSPKASPLLSAIPKAQRLALEMVLHEDDERTALEGELAQLTERWRDAEEIAAISDGMFVPKTIIDRIRGLKGG